MFTDPRTWGTMLYFLLMLPLGIACLTVVVAMTLSLSLLAAPLVGCSAAAGGMWAAPTCSSITGPGRC